MTYTQTSPEWQNIIAKGKLWFAPETMEFWNSSVLWDTLTPIGDGEWLFLSLEDNSTRTARMFSVRKVEQTGYISTLSFQQTSNEDEAVASLNEYSFELGSC